MNHFEAVLYGIVQGITEYLPVSSSAHLILLPKFLGIQDPGLAFDVFLHLGTLFATLIYFWRDWWAILQPSQFRASLTRKVGVGVPHLVIATIPAVIAGVLLHDWVDSVFRGEGVIVVTLVIGAVLLLAADRFFPVKRDVSQTTWKDALIVGLMQCLALVPGMSRSGTTITGARFVGLDRASAARFSFLMSAPITFGAIVYELKKNGSALFEGQLPLSVLIVAFISTFVAGMLSIGFLLRLVRNVGFLGFAVYRIVLSLVVYLIFRPY